MRVHSGGSAECEEGVNLSDLKTEWQDLVHCVGERGRRPHLLIQSMAWANSVDQERTED